MGSTFWFAINFGYDRSKGAGAETVLAMQTPPLTGSMLAEAAPAPPQGDATISAEAVVETSNELLALLA